jgi:hypothetical protein
MLSAPERHSEKSTGTLLGVNGNALTAWLGFIALGAWTYHEVAEKEFTAILTLSVFAQSLAFLLLHMQISASRSVTGISGHTMIMHATKLLCRLGTTLWLDGYLPTDKSGEWIYQLGDVFSFLLVLQILFCIRVSHKATYQPGQDTFDVRNLIMGAVVLAVLIHPEMNAWTPFDILWTAHLYIDAVAMVPQLWMISQMRGQVQGLTAHYIAATFLSNSLSAIFWFLAAPELVEDPNSVNVAGFAITGAHVVQLLLLLDFGYYYGKACLAGHCCKPTMSIGQAVDV